MTHSARDAAPEFWQASHGLPFFLLWMAGALLGISLQRLAPLTGASDFFWVVLPVAVLVCAWEGWLLFKFRWRMAAWTLSPMLMAFAWYRDAMDLPATAVCFVLLLAAQVTLLSTVRQRVWAYPVARIGQAFAELAAPYFLFSHDWAIFSEVGKLIPQFGQEITTMGALSGSLLLGEAAVAAVLAWWMPAITRGSRTVSPLPPESMDG
jgi:hypothetical protein